MNDEQFKNRITEVLKEELEEPEHWMYLSFADTKFNGGVIIKAHGITDALMKCNLLQINPHGEVMPFHFPDDFLLPDEKYRNRILTKEDILEIWPDAKSLRELEEEEANGTT